MLLLLLVVIYIAFISLGLPDSVLGPAWPSMQKNLSVPVSYAGIIAMIITGGTILSSLYSGRIIRKFGTGVVTFASVFMTAAALLGFSVAPSFLWLCILAVPLGLGAGSVDAALNNFVALHYDAKHMSWLHCFWGIGATAGPMLMSSFLTENDGWTLGYQMIGIIQLCLAALLFFSLPLWKKVLEQREAAPSSSSLHEPAMGRGLFKRKGVKPTLWIFFCYCALEATAGLWGSSFLVMAQGISYDAAAYWTALFYFGITAGRLVSGFAVMRFDSIRMIRSGQVLIGLGVLMLLLPPCLMALPLGFLFLGLGCAPIYPCMLHRTPRYFGNGLSQSMMGIQMACAYIGAAFMPPLFGIAANNDMLLYPWYLFSLLIFMAAASEWVNRLFKSVRKEEKKLS